jgi:protein SDA1
MKYVLYSHFYSNTFNRAIFYTLDFFLKFLQTYNNYQSVLQVYLSRPAKPNKQLADLTLFLAHVSHCFPEELKTYPQQLIDLLKKYATVLNPETRMSLCRCLMLMRSKSLIDPVPLFQTFFSLMKCQDKNLRKFLYTHLMNDVKKIKTKVKNYKLLSVNI